MDVQAIWLAVLAVATPVAGVVGFAIKVRQVKKLELENKKLHLEIAALQRATEQQDRRIHVATTDEVEKYTKHRTHDIMFSRGRQSATSPDANPVPTKSGIVGWLILIGVSALVLMFLAYLCYDLYRIGLWVRDLL